MSRDANASIGPPQELALTCVLAALCTSRMMAICPARLATIVPRQQIEFQNKRLYCFDHQSKQEKSTFFPQEYFRKHRYRGNGRASERSPSIFSHTDKLPLKPAVPLIRVVRL